MIRHPLGPATDDLKLLHYLQSHGPTPLIGIASAMQLSTERTRAWLTWLERQGLVYDERSGCCRSGYNLTVPGFRKATEP